MRKRRLAALAFMTAASALAHVDARAAMMTHTDLTSLAFESDAVIAARRGTTTKARPYLTPTDTTITKVYKGPLAVGDHLPLDFGLYSFASPFAPPDADAGAPSEDVVLFLRRNAEAENQRRWDAGPVFDWYIEPAGVRISIGGVMHRFEQWSNPGGFAPVLQGHDPYDLVNDPRGRYTYSRSTFEPLLLAALGRAQAAHEALAHTDTEAGRQHLLDMLGPEDPDDPDLSMRAGYVGFYRDDLAEAVIAQLAKEKDVLRTVRAMTRSRSVVDGHHVRMDLPVAEIIRAASDRSLSPHERAAAVSLLGWPRETPETRRAILGLLADPEPEVRAAAVLMPPSEPAPNDPFVNAVGRLFATEQDGRVLLAIKRSSWNMQRPGLTAARNPRPPIVTAYRTGRVVHAAWGTVADTDLHIERVTITARGPLPSQTVRTLVVERKDLGESRGGSTGEADVALAFEPPLALGRWELAAEVALGTESGAVSARTFPLLPLVAKAAAPRPTYAFVPGGSLAIDRGASTDAGAPLPVAPRADDASASPPRGAAPSRTPPGCGCSIPGMDAPRREGVVLLVTALALMLVARRGRARFAG